MESFWPSREEVLNPELNPISILEKQSWLLEQQSDNIEADLGTDETLKYNRILYLRDRNSFFEVAIAQFSLSNGNCFPLTAYSLLQNGMKHTINSASEFISYLKSTFHTEICMHILRFLIKSNESYNISD